MSPIKLVPFAAIAAALLALPALAADPQPTMPAIANDTVAQAPPARPATAEIFRPAPLPNENLATPSTQFASDEPNLRPDLFRMREHGTDVMADTSSEFQRAGRTAPAGGMSLSIPVQ